MLFRVTLSYDGTDFQGWQSQRPEAGRTVQDVVEAALGRLAGSAVRIAGSGRTDTGVHALGQVATFEFPRAIEPEALRRAVNGLLPHDVRILEAAPTHSGFHARRSAVSKLYRYVLDSGPVRVPTRRRAAGFVRAPLEESPVREAAALYLGRRDFAAVGSAGGMTRSTIRTVTRSEVLFTAPPVPAGAGPTLVYEVEADGFLRKMVRSLVGGLVAVGRGDASVTELERALEDGDRGAWPAPAAACGLTLVRVDYPQPENRD